ARTRREPIPPRSCTCSAWSRRRSRTRRPLSRPHVAAPSDALRLRVRGVLRGPPALDPGARAAGDPGIDAVRWQRPLPRRGSSPEDAPRGLEFLYDPHRFNVATSRARGVVIVVASPRLFAAECRTPAQMRMVNGLCRYRELARVAEWDPP